MGKEITTEALQEVLKYLKKNPKMAKYNLGGPFYEGNPEIDPTTVNGGVDWDIFGGMNNTPVNPFSYDTYNTVNFGEPTDLTGLVFDPNLDGSDFSRDDYWTKKQNNELNKGEDNYVNNRGVLVSREGTGKYDQSSNNTDFEKMKRRYNTAEKLDKAYESGKLSLEDANQLETFIGQDGNSTELGTDPRGGSSRAENLYATASLIDSIGGAVGDVFSGVRGGLGAYAFNKRNNYMENWYRQQMMRDRRRYESIPQTKNTNNVGGMSYGKYGGTFDSTYEDGGIFGGPYGDKDWFSQEDTEVDGEPALNRSRKEAREIKRLINQRIRKGYVDSSGRDYSQFARVRTKDFIVDDADLPQFLEGGPVGGGPNDPVKDISPEMMNNENYKEQVRLYRQHLKNKPQSGLSAVMDDDMLSNFNTYQQKNYPLQKGLTANKVMYDPNSINQSTGLPDKFLPYYNKPNKEIEVVADKPVVPTKIDPVMLSPTGERLDPKDYPVDPNQQINKEYSQYVEQFANSPEERAKREARAIQVAERQAQLDLMTDEEKRLERGDYTVEELRLIEAQKRQQATNAEMQRREAIRQGSEANEVVQETEREKQIRINKERIFRQAEEKRLQREAEKAAWLKANNSNNANSGKYGGEYSYGNIFEYGGDMSFDPIAENPYFKEGEYIEFEYDGKMHKGTIERAENGRIYLK